MCAMACSSALIASGLVFMFLPQSDQSVVEAANTHVNVVFQNVYGLKNTNYIGAQFDGKIYLGGLSNTMLGNNTAFSYANTTEVGTTIENASLDAQSLFYHRYLVVNSITNPYSNGGSTLVLDESYYDLTDSYKNKQTEISGQSLMSMTGEKNRSYVDLYYDTATYTFNIYYTVSYSVDLQGAVLGENDGSVSSAVYTQVKNAISNGSLNGAIKYDTYNSQWIVGGSTAYNTQVFKLFKKPGYTLQGLFDSASGGSRKIDGNALTTTVTRENATCQKLYMQWSANSYTVNFDAGEGDVETSSKSYVFGLPYGDLPVPSRKGYIFDGWWTSEDGGQQILESTPVSTPSSHTLYAHWSAKTFEIDFDAGDGQCTPSSTVVTYGKKYGEGTGLNGSLPVPVKPGFAFDGWWTAQEGGERVRSQTIVDDMEGPQTLFARYVEGAFTVILKLNGGTLPEGADDTVVVKYNSTYGNLPEAIGPNNFLFTGWWTAQEGGERIDKNTPVTATEDHELYAQYVDTWLNHRSNSLKKENDVYQISSAEDFAEFAYLIQSGQATQDEKFVQTCDIDLSDYFFPDMAKFNSDLSQPTSYATFSGTFDGLNYDIKNFRTSVGTKGAALFGNNQGVIKNLLLQNVDINGIQCGGICVFNNGTVENCNVYGTISASENAGAIAAMTKGDSQAIFSNCETGADVSGQSAGGIVGKGENANISECISSCSVSGIAVGGILGEGNAVVQKCITEGSVSGTQYAGGMIGKAQNFDQILQSHNFAKVKADVSSGGIIGMIESAETDQAVISSCSTVGEIELVGQQSVGGFVGQTQTNVKIDNCFAKTDFTNVTESMFIGLIGAVQSNGNEITVEVNSTGANFSADTQANISFVTTSEQTNTNFMSSYLITNINQNFSLFYSQGDFDDGFSYDESAKLLEGLPIPSSILVIASSLKTNEILSYLQELILALGGSVSQI